MTDRPRKPAKPLPYYISPEEMLRRVRDGESLEDILDQNDAASRMHFDYYLRHTLDRPDIADQHAERLRAIDLGISQAQSTWHSISDAQRRAVATLALYEGRLWRAPFNPANYYMPVLARWDTGRQRSSATSIFFGRPTVRNLAARELLEWTGGALDPEAAAVPTERLRFVFRHGPRTDIHNPWTSTPKPVPKVP